MTDDCCRPATESAGSITCPVTGRPTKPVGRSTVLHRLVVCEVADTAFGCCDAEECPVVYVGADGTLIDKAQVRTRVGAKEVSEPIPVCYCWSYTKRQIVADVAEHGRSTIRELIQKRVRAGLCRCEITNPTGRCCLGDVGRAIAETSGA